MNKESFYMKNYKIILSIIMITNYIFLALIGSGIFDNVSSRFFETYFILSFTLIPIVLIFALVYTRYKKEEEINLKDYSIYLPFIQTFLFVLLFGIKYIIQLDRHYLWMFIVIWLTFLALNGVITSFLKNDMSKKKYYLLNLFTYLNMISYILIMVILSYDYSILL